MEPSGSDGPRNVFMCHQHTALALDMIGKWTSLEGAPPGRFKASVPPFNKRGVLYPEGTMPYNAAVFGAKIPEAIMSIFSSDDLQDLALSMQINIPILALDTFLIGKMTNVRELTRAARCRNDYAANANAVDRLEQFADAFAELDPTAFTNFIQWKLFVRVYVSAGWEDKLHFDHVLDNFGFLPETARELSGKIVDVTRKDGNVEQVTLQNHAVRWISKALVGFKPVGCLTDFCNLVCAMMESPDNLTENELVELIIAFREKLQHNDLSGMWIPDRLSHDCESDDTLCWLILEHISRLPGRQPLHTLVQLPTDAAFDKLVMWYKGCFASDRIQVFRDPASQNAKAIKGNMGDWLHITVDEVMASYSNVAADFKKFDANGDGVISLEEWKTVCVAIGIPEAVSGKLFHAADTKRNGTLDTTEFVFWMFASRSMDGSCDEGARAQQSKAQDDEAMGEMIKQIRAEFENIDTDGNGTLDFDEWLILSQKVGMSAAKAREVFDEVDADHSGDVDPEEIIEWIFEKKDAVCASVLRQLVS